MTDIIHDLTPTAAILNEVLAERVAQNAKWGQQNHPDGTGGEARVREAEAAKAMTDAAAAHDDCTWLLILNEEVREAFAETDPAKLRTELLQVAAVAAAWAEAIDRRPKPEPKPKPSAWLIKELEDSLRQMRLNDPAEIAQRLAEQGWVKA